MIDVLEQIKSLLQFESSDDFYYLQILQRKKENPHLGSNSRVIKNYYISSQEYLDEHYDEIKLLCNQFNARAMLRLNKRSYSKVAFKAMQNIANSLANGEYSFIRKSYDRACGEGHNDSNKKWIIDLDGIIEQDYLNKMIDIIYNCQPVGDKILIQLPTKNGLHLITKPFDLRDFRNIYPNIDIHKDNPINLYIP
jgi:bisphosphoglycerate-dependent phosphoglycerate mutase